MNFYEILGVRQDAPDVVIKAAYKALSQKHHPDRGGDAEVMKRINEAYETLSDAQTRKIYDSALKQKPSNTKTEKNAYQGSVKLLNEPSGWKNGLELFYRKHRSVIKVLINVAIVGLIVFLPLASSVIGVIFGVEIVFKLCALVAVGALAIYTIDNSTTLQKALLANERGLYDAKSKKLAWLYVAMVVALAAFILFGIFG